MRFRLLGNNGGRDLVWFRGTPKANGGECLTIKWYMDTAYMLEYFVAFKPRLCETAVWTSIKFLRPWQQLPVSRTAQMIVIISHTSTQFSAS